MTKDEVQEIINVAQNRADKEGVSLYSWATKFLKEKVGVPENEVSVVLSDIQTLKYQDAENDHLMVDPKLSQYLITARQRLVAIVQEETDKLYKVQPEEPYVAERSPHTTPEAVVSRAFHEQVLEEQIEKMDALFDKNTGLKLRLWFAKIGLIGLGILSIVLFIALILK